MLGNLDKRLQKIEQTTPAIDPNYVPTIYLYGDGESYVSDKDKEVLEEMKKYKGNIDITVTLGEYTED